MRYLLLLFFVAVIAADINAQSPNKSVPYKWKNVQMSGGGLVDGIIFHPMESGGGYARTDMGGAYCWNYATQRWNSLLDRVTYKDNNPMGVESIAVDINNQAKGLSTYGTYATSKGPNAILRADEYHI